MRCERLELTCSYVANETTEESATGHSDDLTQAGIKRRRILRACAACRIAKSKCSGIYPCSRCQASGQQCVFGNEPSPSNVDIGMEVHPSPMSTTQTHYGSVPSQASIDMSPAAAEEMNRYVHSLAYLRSMLISNQYI
jgi:hypothetical protein